VNPFRRRTVIALSIVAGLSFLSALFWSIFGPELTPDRSALSNTFSRSATGHHAFVQLLRELGIPVVVSRHDSGGKADRSALLVVAEPDLPGERAQQLRTMVRRVHRALVVLPKWEGRVDRMRSSWLEHVELKPGSDVEAVLEALHLDATVVRTEHAPRWTRSTLGPEPSLTLPQLVVCEDLRPLVATDEGILLGEAQTRLGRFYVLSDPDVLANHGLGRGDNAVFSVAMLNLGREDDAAVVFDETLHGFVREPSLYRALFEFPLVLPTLQAAAAVALLLWASMARFGAPRPVRPALEPGKEFLIGNTAELLRFGGHTTHVMARYFRNSVADVRARLHVAAALDDAEARELLDRNAEARDIPGNLETLERQVHSDQRPLVVARRIHRWREEMIHGRGERT